eukprot:755696-Hanusia_phi.AAC.2
MLNVLPGIPPQNVKSCARIHKNNAQSCGHLDESFGFKRVHIQDLIASTTRSVAPALTKGIACAAGPGRMPILQSLCQGPIRPPPTLPHASKKLGGRGGPWR